MCLNVDMPPPHTPGSVGAPSYKENTAAARRDALNPKPYTLSPKPYTLGGISGSLKGEGFESNTVVYNATMASCGKAAQWL